MPKTPYEFNIRQSGFFSKFGSAAIALDALVNAFSVAAPSTGACVGESLASAFDVFHRQLQPLSTLSRMRAGPEQLASSRGS
jgi:hypothetical protein